MNIGPFKVNSHVGPCLLLISCHVERVCFFENANDIIDTPVLDAVDVSGFASYTEAVKHAVQADQPSLLRRPLLLSPFSANWMYQ
jgi:hypothetical protein